jgi:hypothetical protein
MGPQSKEQVCNAIGYLIEEQARTRALLERLERMLRRRNETDNADLVQLNSRMSEFEKKLRGLGASPA